MPTSPHTWWRPFLSRDLGSLALDSTHATQAILSVPELNAFPPPQACLYLSYPESSSPSSPGGLPRFNETMSVKAVHVLFISVSVSVAGFYSLLLSPPLHIFFRIQVS